MTRALLTSIVLHVGVAAILASLSVRRVPPPQEALQVAVIDVPAPQPPPAPVKALPKPAPVPMKLARAPKPPPSARAPLPTPVDAPPPPTHEAKSSTPEPVVITGITLESTSQGGSFAAGAGNTLQAAPEQTAHEPQAAKPYKAENYASAAQVTELPRPLNAGSVNLRKYYPPQALKEGFEGDVVLRLLIDADGSVARVDVVSDPGSGLGPAAAKMVKTEYRFSPAKLNGTPVATTVPFTVHFTLN